jgi:hypothetical protein
VVQSDPAYGRHAVSPSLNVKTWQVYQFTGSVAVPRESNTRPIAPRIAAILFRMKFVFSVPLLNEAVIKNVAQSLCAFLVSRKKIQGHFDVVWNKPRAACEIFQCRFGRRYDRQKEIRVGIRDWPTEPQVSMIAVFAQVLKMSL